jgi:hypothetical protein
MMLLPDPDAFVRTRRRDLLAEADAERLAALVPRRPSVARRALARGCYRLADWLDAPSRYLRASEAGPEHWVSPWISA